MSRSQHCAELTISKDVRGLLAKAIALHNLQAPTVLDQLQVLLLLKTLKALVKGWLQPESVLSSERADMRHSRADFLCARLHTQVCTGLSWRVSLGLS